MLIGRSYAVNFKPTNELLAQLGVERVDFVLFNGSIPIEEIRRVINQAHQSPFGSRRILWVEEANKLSEISQNSLLKIVEEPPAKLTIVFELNNIEVLLPTLRSRIENKIGSQFVESEKIDWDSRVNNLVKIKERPDMIAELSKLLGGAKAEMLKEPNAVSVKKVIAIDNAINRISSNANTKIVIDDLTLRITRESGKE
ncbi:hypothetical protein HY844_02905 [Candidatus Berkelbacteria bacterium]|nr:hypothetical protein [Candidatus Berkelbacteria bacterium]